MDPLTAPIMFESAIILAPFVAILAYFVRKALTRIDDTMSEEEIRMLIDDKLGPLNANQRNIYAELNRMDAKLDELLRILIDDKINRRN